MSFVQINQFNNDDNNNDINLYCPQCGKIIRLKTTINELHISQIDMMAMNSDEQGSCLNGIHEFSRIIAFGTKALGYKSTWLLRQLCSIFLQAVL